MNKEFTKEEVDLLRKIISWEKFRAEGYSKKYSGLDLEILASIEEKLKEKKDPEQQVIEDLDKLKAQVRGKFKIHG